MKDQKRDGKGRYAPDQRGKKAPDPHQGSGPAGDSAVQTGTASITTDEAYASFRKSYGLGLTTMSGIECHCCGKETPSREWDGSHLPDEDGVMHDYCSQCVSDYHDEGSAFFPSV